MYNRYMKESFGLDHEPTYDPEKKVQVINNAPGEETVVDHESGEEHDTKTLNNSLPDLAERIKKLESEGWTVFSHGAAFVVLQRDTKESDDNEVVH